MIKPKILVLTGYGINCEEETKFAFDWAGGLADILHINDLIESKQKLKSCQILAIPGGFAYGDDTGAGNAYAHKLKNHLWQQLLDFIKGDKLIIGICNGFQILVNCGLLPALNKHYGERVIGLMPNEIPRYTVRFVDLKCQNTSSPWLKGINNLSIPVSNGEGKLFAENRVLKEMQKKNLVAFRYFQGEMCEYLNLSKSPNGSIDDIAGIVDETGRILGLMPHPERAMFFVQLPNWPVLADEYKRQGKKIPKEGPGLKIFENGVKYFK